jgi:3-keto-5-aminohexanoate cleavage enzyme
MNPLDIEGGQPPLILNFAPTGMVHTREMSPHVPLQPDEIVREVIAAASLGITMVHLHARDKGGRPTYKKEVYSRIIGGIRESNPDLVVCVSCSGRDFKGIDQRADVLELDADLRPDMGSLTLASLNFARQASINEPEMVLALVQRMLQRGIAPEFEVFDLGMANYAKYLVEKLGLKSPIYANIMLGNIASAQADLLSMAAITQALPAATLWGLGGIGNAQIPVTAIASAIAPAVRVGLEDNLWLDASRTRLATNMDMVERVHQLAALSGRTIMQPNDLRARLGLAPYSFA